MPVFEITQLQQRVLLAIDADQAINYILLSKFAFLGHRLLGPVYSAVVIPKQCRQVPYSSLVGPGASNSLVDIKSHKVQYDRCQLLSCLVFPSESLDTLQISFLRHWV